MVDLILDVEATCWEAWLLFCADASFCVFTGAALAVTVGVVKDSLVA